MIKAALEYLAERFPLFPNLVGAVLMFAGPAAVGLSTRAMEPSFGRISIALSVFVLALIVLRLADDLVDFASDHNIRTGSRTAAQWTRLKAMQALAGACSVLILLGSSVVPGGWLMIVFLSWLALVSSTLNRRNKADLLILWSANEVLYLPLLLFAFFAGAGSSSLTIAGVEVVLGNWFAIEAWEIARKSLRVPKPTSIDIYTSRFGRLGVRILFLVGYSAAAILLALAASSATTVPWMGAALVLGTAAACLAIFWRAPESAILSFFVSSNLELLGLAEPSRWI